ncbi:MAG: hypothetical protein JWQ49_4333 [Edaphobacter sp.]|nr:hypothetical protein [Edaphobacter sp.]
MSAKFHDDSKAAIDDDSEQQYDRLLEEARRDYALDPEFRASVDRVRHALKQRLPEPCPSADAATSHSPVEIARALATSFATTLADCMRIRLRVPRLDLSGSLLKDFELPLADYFREVGDFSEDVLGVWAEARLAIQIRDEGIRLSLHAAPPAAGLIVCFEDGDPVTLTSSRRSALLRSGGPTVSDRRIGIAPFDSDA